MTESENSYITLHFNALHDVTVNLTTLHWGVLHPADRVVECAASHTRTQTLSVPFSPLCLPLSSLSLCFLPVSRSRSPPAGIHTCVMGLTRSCAKEERETTKMEEREEDEAMEEMGEEEEEEGEKRERQRGLKRGRLRGRREQGS